MNKKFWALLGLASGILLVTSVGIAGLNHGTGITQTSHELRAATGRGAHWDAGTAADPVLDRICIYCHAAHNTITSTEATAAGVTYYPLWNHDLTSLTYTTYQNTTTGDIPGEIKHQLNADIGQPGSISKLCLSCHDGSVGVSSYGNFAGGVSSSKHTGTVTTTGTRFGIGVGGDLSNHHPIGFDYGAVQAVDLEIRDASSPLLGNNPYGMTIADILWGGKIECASCHDVHNTQNTGARFLWVEDTNSNLCFSCHAK